jgi:hypothetical protein
MLWKKWSVAAIAAASAVPLLMMTSPASAAGAGSWRMTAQLPDAEGVSAWAVI